MVSIDPLAVPERVYALRLDVMYKIIEDPTSTPEMRKLARLMICEILLPRSAMPPRRMPWERRRLAQMPTRSVPTRLQSAAMPPLVMPLRQLMQSQSRSASSLSQSASARLRLATTPTR